MENINIVLAIDGNESLRDGVLARELRRLNLKELLTDKFPTVPPPNSWFRGRDQIDGIWTSRHIQGFNIAVAPHYLVVGDHRVIVIDIPSD